MKKYDKAAYLALKLKFDFLAVECLYLDGKKEDAIDLYLNFAEKYEVDNWAVANP